MSIQDAIGFFDEGEYLKSFEAFVEIYHSTIDLKLRKNIMDILHEAFYLPNAEEIALQYEKNCAALENYPYKFGPVAEYISPLQIKVFPVDDDHVCIYDLADDKFEETDSPNSKDQLKYFFKKTDSPLLVENEYQAYNLKFLNDNVRKSEDVAADNHVYLYYNSAKDVQRLLFTCDLSSLLTEEKLCFLFGEEGREQYPVDWKAAFNIDYAAMRPQRLRISEMNRICYWWKRGYSGSSFSLNVLNENSYIIMKEIGTFLYNTTVCGQQLYLTAILQEIIGDTSKKYTQESFRCLLESPNVNLSWSDYEQFWAWWNAAYPPTMEFTLPEFLRAYFIYLYEQQKPHENPRIVPVILFEPHLNNQMIFWPIVEDFPYRTVMNCIREPIQTAGRIFQGEGNIFIYSDYIINLCMPEKIKEDYYVHRFEDMKLHPRETNEKLCEILNIPFQENMLATDYTEEVVTFDADGTVNHTGEMVSGYDLTPLYRKVDDVFSEFDQIRLKIFYDPILRHYGYEPFNFDECPMSDEDVCFLMKFPLKLEAAYIASGKENCTAQELREILFSNMCTFWKAAKSGQITFPKFVKIESR